MTEKTKTARRPAGTTEMTSDPDDLEGVKRAEAARRERAFKKVNDQRVMFSRLPDQLAGSDLSFRNWQVPGAMTIFPSERDWNCRFCNLYYPHAKGGPLFIDLPSIDYDVERCERKSEAFSKRGIRYTFIKNNEGLTEGLERLEVCDGRIKA